jgi:hypothetical protein
MLLFHSFCYEDLLNWLMILSGNQRVNDTYTSTPKLKKVLGLWQLIIYGIAFMTPIAPAYIYGYVSKMTGGMMCRPISLH